jgi:hypothetical protein
MLMLMKWIFDGRKHYIGPKMDVDAMLHGKVEWMDPVASTQGPEETAKERDII